MSGKAKPKVLVPPDEPLLDRDQVPREIAENLAEPVSYLAVLADEGVGLLKRSFLASKREVRDVVLLPVLFRQVLAFLDAVHLHLVNGSVYAAAPDLRAMFEATLALEWILVGPAERRESREAWRDRWARQYYVSELRQERDLVRSFIHGTPDHAKFKRVAPDLAKKLTSDPATVDAARKRVAELGRHIARRPLLRAINSRFGPLKKKLGYEPAWYRVNGPSSVSQLAQRLQKSDEYSILYKQWSEVAHGVRTKQHVRISGNALTIEPIRGFEGLDQVLSLGGSIAERAITFIIDEYRPGELERFAKKRQEDWKAKRTIPEITVNTTLIGDIR